MYTAVFFFFKAIYFESELGSDYIPICSIGFYPE